MFKDIISVFRRISTSIGRVSFSFIKTRIKICAIINIYIIIALFIVCISLIKDYLIRIILLNEELI